MHFVIYLGCSVNASFAVGCGLKAMKAGLSRHGCNNAKLSRWTYGGHMVLFQLFVISHALASIYQSLQHKFMFMVSWCRSCQICNGCTSCMCALQCSDELIAQLLLLYEIRC